MSKEVISIDVGGTSVKVGVVDVEKLEILSEKRFDSQNFNDRNFLDYLDSLKLERIGLTVPGLIDKTGKVFTPNLKFDLNELITKLKRKYNVNYLNDAETACLSLLHEGKFKDISRGLFVIIGTGLGGAIVFNNKIIPNSAEFGHLIVENNGVKCGCGNFGCLEQYASKQLIDRRTKQIIGKKIDLKELASDKKYREIFNRLMKEFSYYLGVGLATLSNIYLPEKIVIAGGFTYIHTYWYEKVLKILSERVYNKNMPVVEIANLKDRVGIVGAAILAFYGGEYVWQIKN